MNIYLSTIKPLADTIIGFIILLIVSPVLCLIALVQLFIYKGHPLFFQKRPGKGEKLFTLIKFRTMRAGTDEAGNLLSEQDRLTYFGSFLRSTSLDELPQLLNVIKGDMSLVGPRPLLIEYLPLYNSTQKRRHEVRPGITGWAQVNGRNNLSWEEKFELDIWYVENVSLWKDLRILFKTLKEVSKPLNIKKEQHIEIHKFRGASVS